MGICILVGYYDRLVAGVPVPFDRIPPDRRQRPASESLSGFYVAAAPRPHRGSSKLRDEAAAILAGRRIFTARTIELVEEFERGGLDGQQAEEFVREALETFRWHSEATVSADSYRRVHDAHRLIADVVSFKGPHINHLTPRH